MQKHKRNIGYLWIKMVLYLAMQPKRKTLITSYIWVELFFSRMSVRAASLQTIHFDMYMSLLYIFFSLAHRKDTTTGKNLALEITLSRSVLYCFRHRHHNRITYHMLNLQKNLFLRVQFLGYCFGQHKLKWRWVPKVDMCCEMCTVFFI